MNAGDRSMSPIDLVVARAVNERLAAIPHDIARVRDTVNRCLLHARTERARSRLRVVRVVCSAAFPGECGHLGPGGPSMDEVDARAAAYEAKVLARIERLRARAAAKAAEAERLHRGAIAMADQIPMGQPILVGHHSEGRDRRYRERIRARFLRSFAASEEARSLARRADGAADCRAISSDDPRAIEKLRARLVEVEDELALAKRVNALWRTGGASACAAAGIAAAIVERAARNLRLMPSWTSPLPTDNLAASARRIEARIAEIEARASAPTRAEIVIGDVTISEDRDENRVRVRFPRRPGKEATKVMRRWGFVWSPTASAWQRKSSETAWVAAEMAAKELTR